MISSLSFFVVKFYFLVEKIMHAGHKKADDGDAEAEVFDALDGMDVVNRDIEHARHIAGKQRDGDGNVEQYLHNRPRLHIG